MPKEIALPRRRLATNSDGKGRKTTGRDERTDDFAARLGEGPKSIENVIITRKLIYTLKPKSRNTSVLVKKLYYGSGIHLQREYI